MEQKSKAIFHLSKAYSVTACSWQCPTKDYGPTVAKVRERHNMEPGGQVQIILLGSHKLVYLAV